MNNELIKKEINFPQKPVACFSMPTLQETEQLVKFCQVMATSPFYQRLTAAGIMSIYLTAKELNLPFMACLNGGLYTFDGKVTVSAQLMNMMIINAGHRIRVVDLNSKRCEIEFFRGDRDGDQGKFKYEYTIEMAEKAGYLGKDNWKKNPRDMLFARCLSGGARKWFPDALMNAYVVDEIESEAETDSPTLSVAESTDTISSEQVRELEELLLKDISYPKFKEKLLLKAKCNNLDEIKIDKFDIAIKWINSSLEQQVNQDQKQITE